MNWFTQSPVSLKVKLPISIVTIVVITFIISTLVTFNTFTSVVQSVKSNHLESTAQNISENIFMRTLQAGRDMVVIASLPNVLQAVDLKPTTEQSTQHKMVHANLTSLFERILTTYEYYNSIYLVNEAGDFILGTRPLAQSLKHGVANIPFRAAKRAGGFYVGDTIYSTRYEKALIPIFLELVYNGYSGYLVSSLDITKIANYAIQSVPHESIFTHVFSVSDSSIINIAHEGPLTLPNGPWIEKIKSQPSGVLTLPINGSDYTLGFTQVPHTNIYTVVIAQKSFMALPRDTLRYTTLITNIIAVLIITVFLFNIIIPMMREITQLSHYAKSITEGGDDTAISTERQDELGKLSESLETMVIRLKDMIQRSEEATKAKSDFLARMSHEIRTPMNGILGMTHLALQAKPDGKQKDFLLRIDTAAKTLLGVINDILDFSKIEADKLDIHNVTFRISGILSSMRDMLEERAENKGLQLIFTVDKDVPDIIHSDPLRFAQICINLCSNSIKFTEKGQVHMHISLLESQAENLKLKIAVQDNGIGIAREDQEKIFDSFSQADGTTTRKYGGTGLGLSISKSLANLLGGEIWVESILGEGSTFCFTMLATTGKIEDLEEKDHSQRTEHSLPALDILLVEDNEINQEIALAVLNNMGVHATLAKNGIEAIAAFESGNYDLILMDIQMPTMDGITATKAIRKSEHANAKTIPIIAMTAHAMTGDKEKSLEAGMNDHITKPIDINELHNTLLTWSVDIVKPA